MQESPRAKQAWADYLGLGPDRSLEKLHRLYLIRTEGGTSVPTKHLPQLKRWSARQDWQLRLTGIADQAAAEAEAQEARSRREIMETGYAAAHERVALLKGLAAAMARDLGLLGDEADPQFWLEDVKGIGQGHNYERVTLRRFNAAQIEQLRGVLDDLAAETGGRTKRVDIGRYIDWSKLTDEQVERMANGEDIMAVLLGH